ncbi:MAG: GNAT family N-acetyltransferase [Solobacterium sp.]|nr:GNAT family N-acetyltransferase [Solobacterium sp.]
MIKVKTYEELTKDELYRMLKARQDVFVVEQNCPYPDIDETDLRSVFVFLEEDERHLASCRIFCKDEKTMQIGRMLTTERSRGYGALVLAQAIETAFEAGAETIYLEAQTYAIGFYGREGFTVTSDEFLEDGIPHVCMELHRQSAA